MLCVEYSMAVIDTGARYLKSKQGPLLALNGGLKGYDCTYIGSYQKYLAAHAHWNANSDSGYINTDR